MLNGKTTSKKEKLQSKEFRPTRCFIGALRRAEIEKCNKQHDEQQCCWNAYSRTEEIKYFGLQTIKWPTDLMSFLITTLQIPKIWRISRVVALLTPSKDPADSNSFHPVSLPYHLFNILGILILNRMVREVHEAIIQEACFRPKKSCSGQTLNLTQHIENGSERKKILVVFID